VHPVGTVPGNTITPNPDALKKYNADVYDDASAIYDTYEGLFFPYLFGRIRDLITGRFIPALPGKARVLDIGCGTGQQTQQFLAAGCNVTGIDISAGLVRVANRKLGTHVCLVSDACSLPFADASFDAVSCAGSTVNHIPDYQCFFDEIGRVLKPGGIVFLESDNKWRPDMFWCLLSTMVGDPLAYHEKLGHVIGYFRRPLGEGYPYEFPLAFDGDKVRMLHLRTFTHSELSQELRQRGFEIESVHGIHAITNVIPSPLMLKDRPGRATKAAFRALSAVEDRTYGIWPVNRCGMSIILIAHKKA
jgi:ubiquinone/menaquinone biosynthesis C-methylase UbiE